MIDPHAFSQKQMELAGEFAKFVLDHPEIDERLPDGAYIYFDVAGEAEFNQYSRKLAEDRQRNDQVPIVCVRIKGLAPVQGSRLLEPTIDPMPASTP